MSKQITQLGTLLHTARTSKGLSIDSVSVLSGVAKGTITNLEKGWTRTPAVGSVVRIAKALKVPGGKLMRAVMEDEKYVEEVP